MIKLAIIALAAYLAARVIFARRPTWHVNAVISFVIIGSLSAIILFEEIWPFSPYPMFAGVQRNELTRIRLFGITDEEPSREIPLLGGYCWPFGEPDLVFALNRIARRDHTGQQLELAARDCLGRYEERRQQGAHDGPPLKGIRLYTLQWQLDPRAANRDDPTKKTLLLEVILTSRQRGA